MDIEIKNAELSEIDSVLELQSKYHVNTIDEADKADGFVTTSFTVEQLTDLILKEDGLVIAKNADEVLAYIMVASWDYWSAWPMFKHMIKDLPNLTYHGQSLSINNSYQYGPICLDKSIRGKGVLEQIFSYSKEKMSKRYPILVTFVNKNNARSYEAHKRKLSLDVIQEFEFNGNHYYEMACLTGNIKR